MKLFFYGVLLEGLGDWPFLRGIGPARQASVAGRIFAIEGRGGWFPALVSGSGTVMGAVHDAGTVDLVAMDEFEGSEYERRVVEAQVDGSTIKAQAYVWNAPLPSGAIEIPEGDFARWLNETGRRPIAG